MRRAVIGRGPHERCFSVFTVKHQGGREEGEVSAA